MTRSLSSAFAAPAELNAGRPSAVEPLSCRPGESCDLVSLQMPALCLFPRSSPLRRRTLTGSSTPAENGRKWKSRTRSQVTCPKVLAAPGSSRERELPCHSLPGLTVSLVYLYRKVLMSFFQAPFFFYFLLRYSGLQPVFISAVEQSGPVVHIQALFLMSCSSFLFLYYFFFTRVKRTEG